MKLWLTFLTLYFIFTGCSTPYQTISLSDEVLELSPLNYNEIIGEKVLSYDKAFESFKAGCQKIKPSHLFYETCHKDFNQTAKAFFQEHFIPYVWEDSKHEKAALMTGYYEPLLEGRLQKDAHYTIPLLSAPKDLIRIYLADVIPELKGKVVRGRLKNGKIIPYFTRDELTKNPNPKNVICWVKDKVDLFFLQIQGSGRILLDNNQTLFVGYGDKNGHPYKSIGNYMIKHKIMSYGQMSLQGIKQWALQNPEKIDDILNQNPSYLFFVVNNTPAKGAMGVVLTPKHSFAVDSNYIPLGTPILVQTTHPLNHQPFQSLGIAQDKGAAIKGQRRLDFFWGFGEEAAQLAGHTKSRADILIFLPKNITLSAN